MSSKNKIRCSWCAGNDLYTDYHDKEWGVPVHDDRRIFEFLILEGFQAGLSWLTILKKRENFREAFDHFDCRKIAEYDQIKIDALLINAGIIRNRLKVNAAVSNARAFLEVQAEFGSFDRYIWGFVDGEPVVNAWRSMSAVPTTSDISDKLSKDLKQRKFKFVGSTIVYAYMQAAGMVNDHLVDCFRYSEVGV